MDLRAALEAAVHSQNCRAAFVLSGSVAASASQTSSHLHMAVFTATGQVLGGHVAAGCIVCTTTADALLALLSDWQFTREPDATTGYDELVVRARGL